MYYGQEDDERDPFDDFGEIEETNDSIADDFAEHFDREDFEAVAHNEPAVIEPKRDEKIRTGFSWAGFAGGLMAFVWIGGAIGGPLTYFGVEAVMAMDPAMQAGLIALAFGPALLFWVAASAAGEALKARKLAAELTRLAHAAALPMEAGEAQAQRLTNTVKNEIGQLNDAVSAALDRLAELEAAAQRNAALFGDAVAASRANTQAMTDSLAREREALVEVKADIKDQTDVIANSIGRQVRLMREASKLVKTEVTAAEHALESHLTSFASSANVLGEHTAKFHKAADHANAAAASLNGSMTEMLGGLAEATRLTETARKSTAEAVLAANETASAVRETTRNAVNEAKRAAQLIRAEAQAMQEAANDTMARLSEARTASSESQAAAERQAAAIEKRLGAIASLATSKKVERQPEPVEFAHAEEMTTLHAAANAAVSRGSVRPRAEVRTQVRAEVAIEREPKRVFKGFGSWGNFMPPQREEAAPVAANESAFELADFGRNEPVNKDATLKTDAIDIVTNAGVDLDDVLHAGDLERIARCSRDGASARRRAVIDAAPGAVTRLVRHMKRNVDAHDTAIAFRSRPDLAKSENKEQGSDLVRAYLLIDAALA
ncbi:hypothetical protein [Candidatus Viadribacter manganicus]|uniref:Uncharacterized protein n=1 Tax=Candidatus Viadribacter manganicus TaxID=1759059 RepID=A0A1B1AL72_9PROT|nr:hypothetical protein [Candidatus Viadribacter manganicus]ANP47294.1 hypothetical protein ATE48_15910 [Candidatus Viadribacter manganicus]